VRVQVPPWVQKTPCNDYVTRSFCVLGY